MHRILQKWIIMKSFHSLLSVSYNWIRLIPSINRKGKVVLLLIGSLLFVSQSSLAQSCGSYTTWRSGMWIGPGSHCGSLYGGTTVSYNGRLYTHKGYCSSTGPGTWDFRDIGACSSCSAPSAGSIGNALQYAQEVIQVQFQTVAQVAQMIINGNTQTIILHGLLLVEQHLQHIIHHQA
jgi:hypothetical protein